MSFADPWKRLARTRTPGEAGAATSLPVHHPLLFLAALGILGCGPMVSVEADCTHATARAPRQTVADQVPVLDHDVAAPYEILADLEVAVAQRGALGTRPTRADVEREMRIEAARIGADAVILFRAGEPGVSLFSYHEWRARGRAIRYGR